MSALESVVAGRPGWEMKNGAAHYLSPKTGNTARVHWCTVNDLWEWHIYAPGEHMAGMGLDGLYASDLDEAITYSEQQAAIL